MIKWGCWGHWGHLGSWCQRNHLIKSVTVKKIPDTVVKHYCVWYLFNCNSLYVISSKRSWTMWIKSHPMMRLRVYVREIIPLKLTGNRLVTFTKSYTIQGVWTLVTNKVDTMMDPLFKPSIHCGFGNFRPKWLQCFNNSKCYMVVHCLLSIFQVNKHQSLWKLIAVK